MKKLLATIVTLIALFLCACTPNNAPIQTPTPSANNVTPTPEVVGCYTPTPTALQIDTTKFTSLYVTGSLVNVRKEANTDSQVLTALERNTLVKAYFEKDGWYYISINDNTFGYMSAKYLSENRVPETREEALGYTNLTQIPEGLENDYTTGGMMNKLDYRIVIAKEKISQITQKIKAKDSKIGAKVDALVTKWNEFVPNNTQYYYDLILEFEPSQGSLFYVTRIDQMCFEYEDLLDVLENIYLMMIGFEKYIDKDMERLIEAGNTVLSEEYYEKKYEELRDSLVQLQHKLNNDTEYAQEAQKVLEWHQTWFSGGIYNFLEIKWQILEQLDFSKNSRSFELYKAYDRYEAYKDHEYAFKDIDSIMRGNGTFAKG